ncbi:ewing's tumor-associated antigen 1 [Cololabis saira]|uniref:ewing's tumor-associated antigen 1 n=1 Tax=Cololabis saira TaxID=129043 RepID=UPI002AD3ACC2|nr:ewing's tumor-associated antigen 1 [Cololabis saira]
MRGRRGQSDPVPAPVPGPRSVEPPRQNRLSRRFRLSQVPVQAAASPAPAPVPVPAPSPQNLPPEFKTPTRVPRPKSAAVFSEESPHNDSDLQQDIIWDATSPSPRRLGKRGKKHTTGVVNISEIVSRIAPKHGRPLVAEPTLQQWIGDSATIPCTPDVQAPRAKKKSPRPSGVDDLLRLAKRFDLNLFQQGEDELQVDLQQSPELLQEDVLDLENNFQSDFSSPLAGSCPPAASTAAGTAAPLDPDQQVEDDLDFLFDGPTQHMSGNLSQVIPAASGRSTKACGKPPTSSRGPASGHDDAFEDDWENDWENDDLLNDSLVMEMTQNPQRYIVPKLCSTQKAASLSRRETWAPVSTRAPVSSVSARAWISPVSARAPVSSVAPAAGSGVQKENVNPRATFRLNSTFCDRSIHTDSRKQRQEVSRHPDGQQRIGAAGSGPQTAKPEPLRSQSDHRTSVRISQTATKPGHSFPRNPGLVSSHCDSADFLQDDLDSLFSLDPVWDDPADDDLLCEMCDDLENQIQDWDGISTEQAPPSTNRRAALQPAHRTLAPPPPGPGHGAAEVKSTQQRFRFTQKPGSGGALRTQINDSQPAVASSPQQRTVTKNFSFKKPSYPIPMETNDAAGKCSAAEIQLKKQQAMERRRQRLQADQNLRGHT